MLTTVELEHFAKATGGMVRDVVAHALAPLKARIEALESRALQRGEKGDPGERGESGIRGEKGDRGEAGEQGPRGEPGPQGDPGVGGKDGRDGTNGVDGKSVTLADLGVLVAPLIERTIESLPKPRDGLDGKDGVQGDRGPSGRDGADGADGKSVSPEQVRAIIEEMFAAVPRPKDGLNGKDGEDGRDGTSVAIDDLRAALRSMESEWALDFERRAQSILQSAIDRVPAPKDGKDGLDGVGFDDLSVAYDGRRTFTLGFVCGEKRKEFSFKVPVVLECGVWKEGDHYERGDGVTFGGSYWIAQRDSDDKPGTSDAWRLAVKKGRDGRDGDKP